MDKILLVDDELFILKALERLLRRAGFQVYTADSGAKALQLLAITPCQVVISDFRMPEMTGGVLLKHIAKEYPQTVCMILSGYADFNAVIELLNAGVAFRFLQKPWDDAKLLLEVNAALAKYKNDRASHIRSQFLISSSEPLLEITTSGLIHRSNAAAQQLLQLSSAELSGLMVSQLFCDTSTSSIERFLNAQQSQLLVILKGREFELVMQKADFEFKLVKLQFIDELPPQVSSTVNLPMVLGQSELIQQADNLLYAEEGFALVSLQIRDFNLITDMIGFQESERLFELVAASLLKGTADYGRLAYLANEQFVLLFPQVGSESELHQQILAIVSLINSRQLVNGKVIQLGFVVAYVLAPEDGLSGKSLLNNVLLTSRLNSRGRHDFFMRYSSSLTENRKQQMQLSEALYHAIENDELRLVFQPKWDISSQKIMGAEVLLRWHSKVFGTISPAVFIPIAEQDGQIAELGRWVLNRTCQYLALWQKQEVAMLPLAINLSVLQLQDNNIVTDILSILKQNEVATDLLQLEVTESAVMENLDTSIHKLQALRDAGFSIAIDDFGTGYSSLAYLTRLPVDTLKVDRSLIMDLEGNLSTQTMLQNIIRMAHDLKQKVIVEGVETAEQLAILAQFSCDQAQGFLLSKPLDTAKYLELVAETSSQSSTGGFR